jgi:hypothetical protein
MFQYIFGVSEATSELIFWVVIVVLLFINGYVEYLTEKDTTVGDDNDTC